ncbi:DNA translocase FtsK [Listeria sp. PSOL-1]|uniref:DNA translocase FtsK n=1 Tax=Listeria sp. PSOL-1 TaxID=1844999 RepID=UPI0013D66E37|nr:DNA translocase FtsK [Listeria sp. PSOL-1]
MGWFKDFFFGDMETEEEYVEKPAKKILPIKKAEQATKNKVKHLHVAEEKQRNHQQTIQRSKRTVQTKMTYQYPKGEFRFPLIPDEPKKTVKIQDIAHDTHISPTQEAEPILKSPFTATDVPSPVFAFNKRPSNFEFNLENNVESTSLPEIEEIISEVKESERERTFEKNEQHKMVSIEKEEKPANLDAQSKEKERSNDQEQVKSFTKQTETRQKSHIPFNVMMVNQDLEKNGVNAEKEGNNQMLSNYNFPSFGLLTPPVTTTHDEKWLDHQEVLLNETLQNFNVKARVVNRTQGPAVTRFEVQPEKGVKVSKITNLTDDIKLNLAAKDIRIEAPIPGKSTVGIEIPNLRSRPVMLSEIMNTALFQNNSSPLTAALGLDISGTPIITDLQKMPHGLIAGATGSGKSVCINSLLVSLLYKATPDELKLLLIDPKMVELAPYNRIPHLVSPVITDAKAATAALKWAVEEMERRYQLFSHTGVRNMEKYNEYASHPDHSGEKLPYVLIVIDELADLMMVAPSDVEEAISRIAQKARACGIHMIVATQRPSVDVITGLIKANIPTRISFSVSSSIDSRTILDSSGAEKLLGRGDMLFLANGANKPVRLQGTFVSDEEIDAVVLSAREQGEPSYLFEEQELLAKEVSRVEDDELFDEACDFVMKQNAASTSLLQRHFRIGYNRAARLMDALESRQIVSGTNGSKPRDVIITREQLEKLREKKEAIISY